MASEAAGLGQQEVSGDRRTKVPMPLSLESPRVVALAAELEALGVGWSPTIVDVDDERLNVLARGARCVSLSSKYGLRSLVTGSFHVWAVDDSEFNRLLAKVTLRWYSTVGFS